VLDLIKGAVMVHECKNEDRIRSLETDRTESRVYIKQINEHLHEIRRDIRGLKEAPSSCSNREEFKHKLIMELVKIITTLILMLGAVFGIIKIIEG